MRKFFKRRARALNFQALSRVDIRTQLVVQ
ncbi:hypothetical protein FHR59_003867 [Xanthomonas arboricola]|nr:hypothetical protein [Xanthomonas arboricola]